MTRFERIAYVQGCQRIFIQALAPVQGGGQAVSRWPRFRIFNVLVQCVPDTLGLKDEMGKGIAQTFEFLHVSPRSDCILHMDHILVCGADAFRDGSDPAQYFADQ